MSRRLLARLACALPAAVALLAATTTTSFAKQNPIDPPVDLDVSTTLVKQTTPPSVGNSPSISVSSTDIPFSSLTDSALLNVQQITFSPAGSAGCSRSCDDTASATYLATFKLSLSSSPSVYTTVQDDVSFIADYSNDTDSVSWTNAEANEPYCTPYKDDGTTTDDCALFQTELDGETLDLVLNDAADWNITSDISVGLAPPPPPPPSVPEPAPIALLFAGMLGVGIASRLRSGKRATSHNV